MCFLTRCTVILLSLTGLAGCNHLFYHPSKQVFTTPDKFELQSDAFAVTTPDGETISFWRIHAQPPKLGTVLHFHGNAENMTSHFLFLAWLTHFGFDVVTFDYRGYGASTGAPSRAGVVLDGVTAIRYMEQSEHPYFIVAQSLGGAIAVPAIAQSSPRKLRGLIVESSFASYRDIARNKLSDVWLTWPLQYPLSLLISDDLSPITSAAEIHVPTVVIHGDRDPVVGIEHGRRLYEALGSKEKEFWRIEGGGHTVAFMEAISPLRPKLVDFLCLHSEQPLVCRAQTQRRLKTD